VLLDEGIFVVHRSNRSCGQVGDNPPNSHLPKRRRLRTNIGP
jgi:hypothetical protein